MKTLFSILLCLPLLGGEVTVAWNANPDAEGVSLYRIWRGIEVLAETTETSAVVTLPDEAVTLTVSAVNGAGESIQSAPLPLVALTVQEWLPVKTIHVEQKASAIYRLKIETP